MTILLEIPLAYRAHVVMPRCRVPELVNVVENIPVAIQELSADDAPVLATVGQRNPHNKPGLDPFIYRLVNGRIARSYSAGMRTPASMTQPFPHAAHSIIYGVAQTREDITDGTSTVQFFETPFMPDCRRLPNTKLIETIKPKEWTESQRDQEMTVLLDSFLGAAFVDDVLYVPSSGPAIAHRGVAGTGFWAEPEWAVGCTAEDNRPYNRFFAHDADVLAEYCASGDFCSAAFNVHSAIPMDFQCDTLSVPDLTLLKEAVSASWKPAARDIAILTVARRIEAEAKTLLPSFRAYDIARFGEMVSSIHAGHTIDRLLIPRLTAVAANLAGLEAPGPRYLGEIGMFLANPENDVDDMRLEPGTGASPRQGM